MSSRRFIDRGFWKCPELNGCSMGARLLAIYMFGEECDDFGRVRDDSYRLKHGCFPDDGLDHETVDGFVSELVGADFLARYEALDGTPLLWIRHFHDYQPMKYHAKSRLDRHPDDEFEVIDTKRVKGKTLQDSRPLAPAGNVYGNCDNLRQFAGTCRNLRKLRTPIPTPIPIPTPAQASAPEGQRAPPVAGTDKDLSASAAQPSPDDAGSALPDGRTPDAPEAESMEDNGAFDRADDPKEASRLWAYVSNEFRLWNGYAPEERLKATALARGMMSSHEDRLLVLASVFDTTRETAKTPEKRWAVFGKKLKGRGGGSKAAVKWAKGRVG